MKIVLLGPAGTFSEEAGQKYKKDAEFVHARFVGEIFDMVKNGDADLGLVPIENQLNGTVGETLDNLYKNGVFVVDEIVLPIKHVLAAQGEDYSKIVSHPQALGQCIDFIKASMTKEAYAGYCKGNILKYIFRYEQKNKEEDLHKAQWYLKELIALYET